MGIEKPARWPLYINDRTLPLKFAPARPGTLITARHHRPCFVSESCRKNEQDNPTITTP